MRYKKLIGAMLAIAAITTTACDSSLNAAAARSLPGTTTTIILVRNAERDQGLDPTLNADGLQRAQALADALSENGVTAIYATDLAENRQTARVVADRLGLTVEIIGSLRLFSPRRLADELVEEFLSDHAGGVVLFVGNADVVTPGQESNLEEMYLRLGGTGRPPMRHDDLFIAVVPDDGPVRFIKSRFGEPSV